MKIKSSQIDVKNHWQIGEDFTLIIEKNKIKNMNKHSNKENYKIGFKKNIIIKVKNFLVQIIIT